MRALFEWLDTHPNFFWLPALLATVALVVPIARGWRDQPRERPLGSQLLFAVLLLLFLLAWRWPYLLAAHEYNPDESQFIAGAMTLVHDPVFWRSVDGTTSGPLNFYILIPLHWAGLPFDYFSARLTGLLLSWSALAILHRFFCQRGKARIADLAVLPGAVFFAAATEPDFIHYSSELLPLALLALAIHWLERRPLAAAFVAGLLPWAKLQALPLGAVLGLWQFGAAWHAAGDWRRPPLRRWALLAGCAALPAVLFVGAVAACGEFAAFYHRYVVQNFVYVEEGMSLPQLARTFWVQGGKTELFQTWGIGVLALLIGAALTYASLRRRPGGLVWLGLALLVTAICCILAPSRPSLHYLLLLLVPITLLLGAVWSELWPAGRSRLATIAVAVLALFPLAWRTTRGTPEMFGQFAVHWRQPYSPLGSVLRHWRAPDARLAVWGWMSSAYVESGLPQGTRDVLTVWSVHDVTERDYYRAAYLADLQRNQPAVFVDATGIGAPFLTDRTRQEHESYPALAAYVREHYLLVTDIPPARVFVRNDVLARQPITKQQLRQRLARGRQQEGNPEAPAQVIPANASISEVDHRAVRMVEPSTELRWHLNGGERAISFVYGFHPRAYREGKSDGADFIVELRSPGAAPLEIFHQHLDPAGVPADRGPQRARVSLPPFSPNTELVVRSSPGTAGDTAWDWVYLEHLGFVRGPFYLPEQFPGFSRTPDRAQSRHPSLVDHGGRQLLMLPPPTKLVFEADGSERRLTMSYGLLPGAYDGNGQTDGATYLVEWRRPGGPTVPIFEHRLDPLHRPADRGAQDADLDLPAGIRPGDELILRIEAGASDSWDWTYVRAFTLR